MCARLHAAQVHGVSLEVSGTADGVFTLAWSDDRRFVGEGDWGALGDCSGTATVPSFQDLMLLFNRLCFAQSRLRAEEVATMERVALESSLESAGESASGPASSGAGEPVVLHLQRLNDRASMRKVTVFTDGRGQLKRFTICDNAADSRMSAGRGTSMHPPCQLFQLTKSLLSPMFRVPQGTLTALNGQTDSVFGCAEPGMTSSPTSIHDTRASVIMVCFADMCSGRSPFVFVRPPMWCAHLPINPKP